LFTSGTTSSAPTTRIITRSARMDQRMGGSTSVGVASVMASLLVLVSALVPVLVLVLGLGAGEGGPGRSPSTLLV